MRTRLIILKPQLKVNDVEIPFILKVLLKVTDDIEVFPFLNKNAELACAKK